MSEEEEEEKLLLPPFSRKIDYSIDSFYIYSISIYCIALS